MVCCEAANHYTHECRFHLSETVINISTYLKFSVFDVFFSLVYNLLKGCYSILVQVKMKTYQMPTHHKNDSIEDNKSVDDNFSWQCNILFIVLY